MQNDPEARKVTDDEIDAIHTIYLEMLDDISDCCKANGIYFTLCYGSVLGAVRHHGFIPWDDDVDLMIPRKDFERLKQVFSPWFKGKYTLNAPNYLPGNSARMGKILNPSVVIEDYRRSIHGLEMDIFILGNIPDNNCSFYLHGIRSLLYTAVAGLVVDYECVKSDRNKQPGGKKEFSSIEQRIRYMLGSCFSFRSAEKWLNLLDHVNQYPSNSTKRVGIPTGREHFFGEIYNRENMINQKMMPFENRQYPIPSCYDEYLKRLYGDYMSIPDEKDREHHYIRSITFP